MLSVFSVFMSDDKKDDMNQPRGDAAHHVLFSTYDCHCSLSLVPPERRWLKSFNAPLRSQGPLDPTRSHTALSHGHSHHQVLMFWAWRECGHAAAGRPGGGPSHGDRCFVRTCGCLLQVREAPALEHRAISEHPATTGRHMHAHGTGRRRLAQAHRARTGRGPRRRGAPFGQRREAR